MASSNDFKTLQVAAVAIIGVAVVTVMGILILLGFKGDATSPVSSTTTNTTIDQFISGLAVTGGFISILLLALIGKTVVRMFRGTS